MKPLYLLPLLALFSPAVAQTSEEYALMGVKAHSVWSCSALAALAANGPESDRLFNLGYKLGKTFLEAVRAGKVRSEDLNKYPRTMYRDIIPAGPSIDFDLGGMHAVAADEAVEEGWKGQSIDAQRAKAAETFQKWNCSFLK